MLAERTKNLRLNVANPPFVTDVTPLDAPTAPGKTLPATELIERLRGEG